MHRDMMHEKKIAKSLQKQLIWLRKLKSKCWKTEDRTDDNRFRGWYKNRPSHVRRDRPPFYLYATGRLNFSGLRWIIRGVVFKR